MGSSDDSNHCCDLSEENGGLTSKTWDFPRLRPALSLLAFSVLTVSLLPQESSHHLSKFLYYQLLNTLKKAANYAASFLLYERDQYTQVIDYSEKERLL